MISSPAGSLAAIARACRWHDSENPGALTSGTQIWTWRRPAARMRWRYFAMRREGGTELRLARAIDALFFVTCYTELRQRSREFFQGCRPRGWRLVFALALLSQTTSHPMRDFAVSAERFGKFGHGLRLSNGKGNFQGGSGEPIHFVLRPPPASQEAPQQPCSCRFPQLVSADKSVEEDDESSHCCDEASR